MSKIKILQKEPVQINDEEAAMRKRRTTLADGRYLIYYTFENSPASEEENIDAQPRQPRPRAESSEEKDV